MYCRVTVNYVSVVVLGGVFFFHVKDDDGMDLQRGGGHVDNGKEERLSYLVVFQSVKGVFGIRRRGSRRCVKQLFITGYSIAFPFMDQKKPPLSAAGLPYRRKVKPREKKTKVAVPEEKKERKKG